MSKLVGLAMVVIMVSVACGGDDDVASDGGDDWCDLARKIDTVNDELNFAVGPDSLEGTYSELLELLDQARPRAPDEIRDSVTITADAFAELADALEDAAYDFSKLDQDALSSFDAPELSVADDVIENYNAAECGISSGDAS
jgi:hypothetical protein